jgi:hypothetical protein
MHIYIPAVAWECFRSSRPSLSSVTAVVAAGDGDRAGAAALDVKTLKMLASTRVRAPLVMVPTQQGAHKNCKR